MEEPLVSIICLSYNQSQYITESLNSIKNLDYSNLEIIICDDSSKDSSVDVIKAWIDSNEDLNIVFIEHSVNMGICKSLNECLTLSNGKYIQIFALDDILESFKLTKHVAILESSSENTALVFSDALIMDENSVLYQNRFIAFHRQYLSLKSGNFYRELLNGNFIPAMTTLIKREIFDDIGFFDEKLTFEDYDMWLRIANKYDFVFDEIPTARYRFHSNNTHKKLKKAMNVDTFKILMKHSNIDEVRFRLKRELEHLYLNNLLVGQEKIYFEVFPRKTFLDILIHRNQGRFLYKVLANLINGVR